MNFLRRVLKRLMHYLQAATCLILLYALALLVSKPIGTQPVGFALGLVPAMVIALAVATALAIAHEWRGMGKKRPRRLS